jgi:hypothetical protein
VLGGTTRHQPSHSYGLAGLVAYQFVKTKNDGMHRCIPPVEFFANYNYAFQITSAPVLPGGCGLPKSVEAYCFVWLRLCAPVHWERRSRIMSAKIIFQKTRGRAAALPFSVRTFSSAFLSAITGGWIVIWAKKEPG